jgi:RNA polymerase-associated protein
MATVANRRSVMTLFSVPSDAQCHRARIVLTEKDITVDVLDIDPDDLPEDLQELNPYNNVPTLVDRDLVLYDARVIMEYLDERFPHPPLMPVDPVSRAKTRLMLFRIEKDWYSLLPAIEGSDEKAAAEARKVLRESIASSSAVFSAKPFFLSDEFSLVDCSIAPILWRLPHYGIELPRQAKAVNDYSERIFKRPSFQASLSDAERDMHG